MADGLSSDNVTALLEDLQGTLWIGTRDAGLNRLRHGKVRPFRPSPGTGSLTIFGMIEDLDGRIWVGTVRSGLYYIEADKLLPFHQDPTLEGRSIFSLALDGAGRLLVGTDGVGLKIIAEGAVRTLSTSDGLSNNTIVSLYGDAAGDIWVGTYGGGLNRIRDREISVVRAEDGLPNDRIFRILEDDSGHLWMTCNDGIFSLSKAELEAFFAGESAALSPVVYGGEHGLLSTECAAGTHPAGWRGREGVLWVPTQKGVARLDPGRQWRNPVPPPVWIETISVDGKAYRPDSSPRLEPGQDRFEFTYTGLSFLLPEKVRFRYRLEGFDPDWIDVGPVRSATYTNLPSGRSYRFVVTAANNDGLWNEQGAAFSFYLRPYFHETPAFLGLLGIGLLALAWGGYRLRVRQLVRRTQDLERKVAERTAEVVAEKDRVKAANRELARLNQIKSEFLSIAAHDLKNPLTVILGFANLIGLGKQPAEKILAMGGSISASVKQMLSIISDLLDTTAIEAGQLRLDLQSTDLMSIALEVIGQNHARAADRQIELSFEGDLDADFSLHADGERISRVIDNLIGNAIKFSPDGGAVTLRLERRGLAEACVLRLSVEDRGPGISGEDQRKLFLRFQRLSAQPKGGENSTGLGLSIVKHFVEMHGGRVWVESQPGHGATFWVELPAAYGGGDHAASVGA
jgi:signal transduction histidine kinase